MKIKRSTLAVAVCCAAASAVLRRVRRRSSTSAEPSPNSRPPTPAPDWGNEETHKGC